MLLLRYMLQMQMCGHFKGLLKEWLGKGKIALAVPLQEDIATSQTSVLTKSEEKKFRTLTKNNSKIWISLKRSIYLPNHYTAIPIRQDSYTREVSKWRENCCFSSRFGSVQIAWLIRIITTTSQEMGVDPLQRGPRIIEEMGSVSKSCFYLGHNLMTSILNKHLFVKDPTGHMMLGRATGNNWGSWADNQSMYGGWVQTRLCSHNKSRLRLESFGRDHKMKNKEQKFIDI